jgi:hypothetical protein
MDCWDSSGWGLEHGELRNWMRKGVYRLIFLKNHFVWQILPGFLDVP